MAHKVSFFCFAFLVLLAARTPVQAKDLPYGARAVGIPYEAHVLSYLAAPDADDFEDLFSTYFDILGASAPYALDPLGGLTIDEAARALLVDMISIGYPDAAGTPYLIDGRGATNSIPVLWKACRSTNSGFGGGGGVSLVIQDSDVILLGTGYSGTPGTGDAGYNAYVEADNSSSRVTCYAVGGDGDSASGASAGGWGATYDISGNGGGGANAWGGDGVNGGVGGFAIAGQTAANAHAKGGASDSGNGGAATAGRGIVGSVGGNAEAIGGSSSSGNGGAATVGAAAGAGGNGASVNGDGTAVGGDSSSATGGTALVRNTAGDATSTGGDSATGPGGSGNIATVGPRVGGMGNAYGGDGSTGGAAVCNCTGAGSATGGDGITLTGNAGNGTVNSLSTVAGSVYAQGGNASGSGNGGTASATSPGGNRTVGPTGPNGGYALAP